MKTYYFKDNIKVRTSVKEDVHYLKDRLRRSDIEEIAASHGKNPEEALAEGLENSVCCFTVTNGDPIMMFGICPKTLSGEEASIWMLSSDKIEDIKVRLVRNCRFFIDMFLDMYPFLENHVHEKNSVSIKWLQYLGAEMGKSINVKGERFIHFYFRRKSCAALL